MGLSMGLSTASPPQPITLLCSCYYRSRIRNVSARQAADMAEGEAAKASTGSSFLLTFGQSLLPSCPLPAWSSRWVPVQRPMKARMFLRVQAKWGWHKVCWFHAWSRRGQWTDGHHSRCRCRSEETTRLLGHKDTALGLPPEPVRAPPHLPPPANPWAILARSLPCPHQLRPKQESLLLALLRVAPA